MLLKYVTTDALVEILDVEELASPFATEVLGKSQAGEEEQDSEKFKKKELIFPSGEQLPQCWIDADYRQD